MAYEVILGKRNANVEILSEDGDFKKVRVDDKVYEIDISSISKGVYSVLLNGTSFNVELIEGEHSKKYYANTLYNSFEVEIIDAESKYLKNRNEGSFAESTDSISSPMPGKVVTIPVSIGDKVKEGQTVIVVSAMKMESEYKAPIDGVVKEIYVKESDTVDANQVLLKIE